MPFLDLYSKTEYKKLEAERDTALGMYDSLRLQFNEVDDAHVKTMRERDRLNEANAKLLGQIKELQGLCASLQTERDKLQEKLDEAYGAIADLSAQKPEPVRKTTAAMLKEERARKKAGDA